MVVVYARSVLDEDEEVNGIDLYDSEGNEVHLGFCDEIIRWIPELEDMDCDEWAKLLLTPCNQFEADIRFQHYLRRSCRVMFRTGMGHQLQSNPDDGPNYVAASFSQHYLKDLGLELGCYRLQVFAPHPAP